MHPYKRTHELVHVFMQSKLYYLSVMITHTAWRDRRERNSVSLTRDREGGTEKKESETRHLQSCGAIAASLRAVLSHVALILCIIAVL